MEKTVQVSGYDRDSFQKAVQDYADAEARASQGEKIEPVLVSAGSLAKLPQAYPSFFLDIGDFIDAIDKIIH